MCRFFLYLMSGWGFFFFGPILFRSFFIHVHKKSQSVIFFSLHWTNYLGSDLHQRYASLQVSGHSEIAGCLVLCKFHPLTWWPLSWLLLFTLNCLYKMKMLSLEAWWTWLSLQYHIYWWMFLFLLGFFVFALCFVVCLVLDRASAMSCGTSPSPSFLFLFKINLTSYTFPEI